MHEERGQNAWSWGGLPLEVQKNLGFLRGGVLLVDPGEEKLKAEFAGVSRSFLPMQAVIRIDEVEQSGVAKISSGDNISPFPVSLVGAKPGSKDV